MAAISTGGSGNWSSVVPNAPWPLGTLPTSADDVTILNTHTVTQDSATAAALSITINSGGTLVASQASSSVLTMQTGTITIANGGFLNYDVRAVPAISAEIVTGNINGITGATGGRFVFDGAPRTRWTLTNGAVLAAATTCIVDDATGWKVGDRIILASTQTYNATPRVDVMTLDATYINGSTSLVFTAGLAFDHADNCVIGNFSSNLIVRPRTIASHGGIVVTPTANAANNCYIRDVEFRSTGSSAGLAGAGVSVSSPGINAFNSIGISNNAFFDPRCTALALRVLAGPITRDRNIFYATALNASGCCIGVVANLQLDGTGSAGPDTDSVVFRSNVLGITMMLPGHSLLRCKVSGVTGVAGSINFIRPDNTIQDCDVWACNFAFGVSNGIGGSQLGIATAKGCTIGTLYVGAENSTVFLPSVDAQWTFNNCTFQTGGTLISSTITSRTTSTRISLGNKNNDPLVQETYFNMSASVAAISRDNSFFKGASGSSTKVLTNAVVRTISVPFQIVAQSSQAVAVSGFIWRDGAQPVTVTLSGLGITPSTYTLSGAAGQWEQFLVAGQQTSGSLGILDLTVEITSGIVGNVWIDAISPPSAVVSTGEMDAWSGGMPVQVLFSNFVAASDVWNVLNANLTLAGSVGLSMLELWRIHGLDITKPLIVSGSDRTAGVAIEQTISGGSTVTVQRT